MTGLKSSEIHWVVNSYIGVEGGYLGDFSYRSHRDFYPGYCDLEIDLGTFAGGTTREKFVAVLSGCEPHAQAAILRGIAKRFPQGSDRLRTPATFQQLKELAQRCAQSATVTLSSPAASSAVVEHALKDAAALLETRGPISAFDRVHTALHGYLKDACLRIPVEVPPLATTSQILKLLRQHHPVLSDLGEQHDSLMKIMQGMSSVIEGLSTQRNKASLAHANDHLLGRDDAILAINAAKTLIQFLDAKLMQAQS
jgi:Abortive infection C-terminus